MVLHNTSGFVTERERASDAVGHRETATHFKIRDAMVNFKYLFLLLFLFHSLLADRSISCFICFLNVFRLATVSYTYIHKSTEGPPHVREPESGPLLAVGFKVFFFNRMMLV